jgi:hypothetical protein
MGVPYNSRGATWGPDDEIDEQSFIDFAEHCDTATTTTGLDPNVTRPLYTGNAVISTSDSRAVAVILQCDDRIRGWEV